MQVLHPLFCNLEFEGINKLQRSPLRIKGSQPHSELPSLITSARKRTPRNIFLQQGFCPGETEGCCRPGRSLEGSMLGLACLQTPLFWVPGQGQQLEKLKGHMGRN